MESINIYGEIGWDVTQSDIEEKLRATTGDIEINVISPGGNVFEGFAIYNILKNSKRVKVCNILGLCGSIATLIVASAEKVKMSQVASFMIHNPSVFLSGGEESDIEKTRNSLKHIKDVLVAHYVARTGKTEQEINDWMDGEKWFTANEAKEAGFVDEVLEVPMKAVATFKTMNKADQKSLLEEIRDGIKSLGSKFKNTAPEITNMAITLENGQELFVEGEELEGSKVYLTDESGSKTEEPAPDGIHKLEDGKSITVSEGVITEVKEAEEDESEALKEENAALKQKIEDMEKEKNEMSEKLQNTEANLKALKNESNKKLEDLKNKIERMAKVFGEDQDPPKPFVKPKQEPHTLDGYAERIKNKLKLRQL